MRTITETFTAGEIKPFAIPGNRFEILSSSGPVSVSFQDANGIEITNGFASNIPSGSYAVPDGGFKRIAITSPTGQQITFLIASGESGTRSIAGTVSVVDDGKSRTLASTAFIGTGFQSGVAAQFPNLMLWNKSTSKNLILERVSMSSSTAANFALKTVTAVFGAVYQVPPNKQIALAASANAEIRNLSGAGMGTANLLNIFGAANTEVRYTFTSPIVIPPGFGVTVVGGVAAADLLAGYEFYESPI